MSTGRAADGDTSYGSHARPDLTFVRPPLGHHADVHGLDGVVYVFSSFWYSLLH